jgi:hypothetical protein
MSSVSEEVKKEPGAPPKSPSKEAVPPKPAIVNEYLDQFITKRHEFDGEIPKKDDLVFYCFAHKAGVQLPEIGDHQECLMEKKMANAKQIAAMTREIVNIKSKKLKEKEEKAALIQETFGKIQVAYQAEVTSHKALYTIIEDATKKQILDKNKTTKEKDALLIEQHGQKLGIVTKKLDEFAAAFQSFENIRKQPDSAKVNEWLLYYDQAWSQEKTIEFEIEELQKLLAKVTDLQEDAKIVYKEANVRNCIDKAFDTIHNSGYESLNDQCSSKILCKVNPLANNITIFDLTTLIMQSRELKKQGGGSFNLPYGAAVCQDLGRVFISGGSSNLIDSLPETYEFSVMKELLIPRGNLQVKRAEHTMIAFKTFIFCAGGHAGGEHLNSCERCAISPKGYKDILTYGKEGEKGPKMFEWVTKKPLTEAKSGISLCLYTQELEEKQGQEPEKYIYAFGGTSSEKVLNSIERLRVTNDDDDPGWEKLPSIENHAMMFMGAFYVSKNADNEEGFFIFGGNDGKSVLTTEIAFLKLEDIKLEKLQSNPTAKLTPIAAFKEGEDFSNSIPILSVDRSSMFVAGKFNYYKLRLKEKEKVWEALTESNFDSF